MENKLKKYGLDKIILVVLAGILILIIAIPQTNKGGSNAADEPCDDEKRIIEILEKRFGEGNIDVMISEEKNSTTYFENESDGRVTGVLVMVRTNNLTQASYEIVSAVTALFNVPAHKVIVMEMK